MFNIDYELNEKIHATIINPYLSLEELNANCDLIQKYNIRNVSTSLNFLSPIKDALNNDNPWVRYWGLIVSSTFGDLALENNVLVRKM